MLFYHKHTPHAFLLVLFSAFATRVVSRIVRNNVEVEVPNGRTVYMRKELLSFIAEPGQRCKVEVVTNEPMYQRVGLFTPEIFDCDYLPKSVRYEHNGSPFLSKDTVKINVYLLLNDTTLQETVYLHVSILDSRCDVIQVNHLPMRVPRMTKISNPITRDVVDFDYDRQFDNLCRVEVSEEGFPAYGRLVVVESNRTRENIYQDVQYRPSGAVFVTCEEFVLMGLMYEHLSPPTPNVDYIPLHVVVTDRRSGAILLQERHWLPVTITDAFPNQPPKPSFSNMYILEVDQFVTTNLLPMTVSAVDGETGNENLIFNVTKAPSQGFITHLNDESKPISSFTQQDLQDLQIAYQPPNVSFSERQTFTVEFVVYDDYFAQSNPLKCLFSVRVSYTNAPRVSWNEGLTMLEGQSRPIDNACLQVVDNDNLDQVRFTLAGGLRHGRLYVNNRPGFSFRWNDIESGLVSYRHDDTDSRKDFVVFRVTDGIHSTRFKLPISIIPKDDAPPFLINNIAFEVQEGQTILVHRFMLEASDSDSSSDYIQFNITVPPKAGEIQKRRKWERAGWSTSKFRQSDLYQGLIYYKHLGGELFEDSFDFTLMDSTQPVPNISPPHRVAIKITPIDDLPPQPASGNKLVLVVNETDVTYITNHEMTYIDAEEENSDVTFTVTTEAYRVDGSGLDAGRLVFTDDMVMLMKDPTVPTLRTFTQRAVDHHKVAYMPPMQDIGLHPVDVQFLFSVTDESGKSLTGQRFSITVLPVDNLAPTIRVTDLNLNEGGSAQISKDSIEIHDNDTDIYDLKIILSLPPLTGSVRRDNVPLHKGDAFTVNDMNLFRMTYVHNGSENHKDQFKLIVTDGKQNSFIVMEVHLKPIDDELPVILGESIALRVPEGGSRALTSSFLSASDVDTDDDSLIFEILTPPQHGSITADGEEVITFLQRDVRDGNVFYSHDGSEVGKTTLNDLATVMVSDRRGQPIDTDDASLMMKDLRFTILPVNNQPPRLAIGHRVFRCNEGDVEGLTHNFLMATDEDTPVNDLIYVIESPPTFGYVEDVTPRPGYEKIIGKPTSSFTHEQLVSGFIRYKQSEHELIEPTSDEFSIAVTDGKYKSVVVPFLISITPTNDEEPTVFVTNVTCEEGNIQTLNLDIDDLDFPYDEIMISVVEPPNYGMVIDEKMLSRYRRSAGWRRSIHPSSHVMHDMKPMKGFSLRHMRENRVIPAYMHDGSENMADEFLLKITDGKYASRKVLAVKVMPVNDERPVVAINRGITLELGGTKVISNVALHSTDSDTPNSEIVYELHSAPRRGNLQIKVDDGVGDWVDLEYADTFTERDVEMNRIRYKHASVLGSKGKDSFRFSVTDGDHTSSRQNFIIGIEHTKKSAVHIVTHPLHVNESERAFLSTNVLVARDDSGSPQDITYDVIRNPVFGQLEYVAFPNVSIEMFTQLDLLARNVLYVHTSKEDTPVDTFHILASNGLKSREADVTVLITSVDSQIPTLTIGDGSLFSNEPADLSLFSGSSVAISDRIIKIQDPDTSKKNLKLVLLDLPRHGTLLLREQQIYQSNTLVSALDLQNADLFYQHNGDGSRIDRFTFTVTDGIHTRYIYRGEETTEPTVFNLRIERLDETPPVLVVNQQSTSIEQLGRGRAPDYGVYLDNHLLKAVDSESRDPSDITYSVTQPPSYGVIRTTSNQFPDPVQQFTQLDLNKRIVVYVVSSKLRVTNDSFIFDVEDSWGNSVTGNRFNMAWSRIEMTKKKLKVCEDVGSISLQIRRTGSLETSSFVGIMIKPKSAKIGTDFEPSSASQVQFDPNANMQSWMVTITNDGLEERKEKFAVKLHTPVNTVLSPKKRSSMVIIVDARHRSCGGVRGKKRLKSARKRQKKKKFFKNKKKKAIVAHDQPAAASMKVRYGKLGHGTTVSPATYFRNKTVRIWTYHGLLPISTGEAEDHDVGFPSSAPLWSSVSQENIPLQRLPVKHQDQEELNDEPQVVRNLYKGKFNVENSNTSATITVNGGNVQTFANNGISTIPLEQSLLSSIKQQCVLSKKGALYFEAINKVLYRCDGSRWEAWKPGRKQGSRQSEDIPSLRCQEGWKLYEDRCFLIGIADESLISWNSAQRICRESHSANLVSVHSRKQLNWLWKVMRKSKFLIGLNCKLSPVSWEWVSGEEVAFYNWRKGFPMSGGECVMVSSKKRWVDIPCNETNDGVKYVCVKAT